MKSTLKFACTSFLATSLLFSSVHAADLDSLKDKKEETNEKKLQLESKLQVVQDDISSVRSKLKNIADEIANTDKKISQTKEQINQTKKEIKETEKKIEETTKKLEEKKKILAENLRKLHMKGEVTMMEYLFRSEDVSEFLDRFNQIKRFAKANRALYEEVRETKRQLEEEKAHLEAVKKEQEAAKASLESLKDSQQAKKKEEMSLLAELVEKESSVEHEIDDQEAAINEINAQIADEIKKREEARKKREEEARKKKEAGEEVPVYNEPVGNGQLSLPVRAGSYIISSPYGLRSDPITGVMTGHNGVDFAAPYNTPIYAADSGTVLYSGPASGYGNWIVIDHNNGYYTIYGHMYSDQLYVSAGQTVQKGQKIAGIGSSGKSTGNHLHFAVSKDPFNQNFVNPMSMF